MKACCIIAPAICVLLVCCKKQTAKSVKRAPAEIAYAGGGSDGGTYLKDFYKYNGSTDKWTQILDLPLGSNTSFTQNSLSINSRGHVGTYNAQSDRKLKKYTPRICVNFPGTTPN